MTLFFGRCFLLRFFDLLFSFIGIIVGIPLFIVIYVIGLFDTGSPVFLQERVGKHQKPFLLVKFRTMEVNTKSVASHLADSTSITKIGGFLRKTKLDELPQLWNVLKGDMSLVGPRPNLTNQLELIDERKKVGIYDVRPGITGLSQISDIDMATPELLAKTDAEMIKSLTITKYFHYILATVAGSGAGDRISK
jgi:lipopolysaccharide/colanic/teichoic acid biosynthesis glycosyltransferase